MNSHDAIRRLLARCLRPTVAPRALPTRAGDVPDVQLIAGAGAFELDVLVRVLPEGRIEIVGQVTGAERVHEPVPRLPLALYDTENLACVARLETDPFGEFSVRNLPTARYALALGEARNAPCVLIYEGDAHVAASQRPV